MRLPSIALILYSSVLLSACASLGAGSEPPSVSLSDLRPLEMTLFEQRYRIKLRIQNPNTHSLDIVGMHYTLYLNDKLFARGLSDQAVSVPAFGEGLVEGTVTSHLDKVLAQLLTLESDAAPTMKYRLNGKLAVKNRLGRIPFEYQGELRFPAASDRAAP